jgi:hypothetical protein
MFGMQKLANDIRKKYFFTIHALTGWHGLMFGNIASVIIVHELVKTAFSTAIANSFPLRSVHIL